MNRRKDKQIARTIRVLRNMDHGQRYIILDWLKDWYAYVKQLEEEQLMCVQCRKCAMPFYCSHKQAIEGWGARYCERDFQFVETCKFCNRQNLDRIKPQRSALLLE